MKASVIADALTDSDVPPHILAKKSGRFVRCRVTVILGLPALFEVESRLIKGEPLASSGGDPATLFCATTAVTKSFAMVWAMPCSAELEGSVVTPESTNDFAPARAAASAAC